VEWLAGGKRERGRELKAAAAMAGGAAVKARGGGERRGLNRPARLWVTAGKHLRAMAARPPSVRPATRTDRGSAARTARYGGVAGAARGA
jgi:hypothetical protein